MRARTATPGDLETVFRDLSGRMSTSYGMTGENPQKVQDSLMMDLKEGRAHTLLDGETVVAIISWHETDDAAETIFAARESFFTAHTVRFCQRHIRRIQALAGNLPIHSRSWLEEPAMTRWFRIIGYVEKADNGAKLFELPPI
ncbi:hypothetical protein [Mesorhizobium sp. A623]